jgi:hypothetical protein
MVVAVLVVVFSAMLLLPVSASAAAASVRTASSQPRVVTPCLEAERPARIAPVCAQAVARARALSRRSGGSHLLIAPAVPASSFSAPSSSTTSSQAALPPSGGNSLELKNVGDGNESFFFGHYINGESVIYCGADPSLEGGEIYGGLRQTYFQ